MMDVFGSDFSCYHCQNGRSYSGAAPGFKAVNILFMNIISDYINNARYSRSVLMHSPATMSYLPDNPDFLSAIHDDEYIKELILPENVDTIDLGINSIDFVFDGISNLQIIVNCTTELLTYKEVLCALYFSTYKSQDFYDTHYRFQTKFYSLLYKLKKETQINTEIRINVVELALHHKKRVVDTKICLYSNMDFSISMKRFKNLVYPGYGSFNKFTVSQVYNYQKHNVVVHGFFDTINFQDLNAFNIYDFKSFARNCKIIDKSNTEYWKSYVDNGKQFKYKSFLQFITVLNSVFDFYYISVTSNQNVTIASSTLSSFVSTKSDVGV